jgi:hypothetical protein
MNRFSTLLEYVRECYPGHAVYRRTVGEMRRRYGSIVDVDGEDIPDDAEALVLSGFRASHRHGTDLAFPASVDPQEVAQDYVQRVISSERVRSTMYVDVCVRRIAITNDAAGDPCVLHIYNQWHVARLDPTEPPCRRRPQHRWLKMQDGDCCAYCGWRRSILVSTHGGSPIEKIAYEEPTRGSLAWAGRYCDECGQMVDGWEAALGWPTVDRTGRHLCAMCYGRVRDVVVKCAECARLLGAAAVDQGARLCVECGIKRKAAC